MHTVPGKFLKRKHIGITVSIISPAYHEPCNITRHPQVGVLHKQVGGNVIPEEEFTAEIHSVQR
jgi:hypothetical protein